VLARVDILSCVLARVDPGGLEPHVVPGAHVCVTNLAAIKKKNNRKLKPKRFEPLPAAVFRVRTPVVDHVRAPAGYRLHSPKRRYRDTNLCRPSK
jgi:hypothetical protein